MSIDLESIIKLAKEAGEVIMENYSKDFEVDFKNGDKYDPVTSIDKMCDKLIRERVAKMYPSDEILSEENEDIPLNYSNRVWMIDPVDGTKEFVARNGQFCIMIGLCVDGDPVLGVVYAPVKKKIYFAEKGKGAFLQKNNKKIKLSVSKQDFLSKSSLITRNPHGGNRPLDKPVGSLEVKDFIHYDSVGLKLGLIAEGEADLHINSNFRTSKWDTCAPQIILQEAGGKLTDVYGSKLNYKKEGVRWQNSFIASNKRLHDNIVEAFVEKIG